MAMKKPKGKPRGRQTQEFLEKRFKPISDLPDEPLAKQNLQIKVGQSVYDYLQTLPQGDRINLLRTAITDAVENHRNSV
jgi:hypothetical protein